MSDERTEIETAADIRDGEPADPDSRVEWDTAREGAITVVVGGAIAAAAVFVSSLVSGFAWLAWRVWKHRRYVRELRAEQAEFAARRRAMEARRDL